MKDADFITIKHNGVPVQVHKNNVGAFIEAIGEGVPMYLSRTHGLMPIKDMDTNHLVNAMHKIHREWSAGIPKTKDGLLNALHEGCKSQPLIHMYLELKGRDD